MHDTLSTTIKATHDVLESRLSHAEGRRPTRDRPRDQYPAVDTFLASASRHLGAVNAVLVPAARKHLPDGDLLAQEFTTLSRTLEYEMAQAKAKLYGSTYAIRRQWPDIWHGLHEAFDAMLEMEERVVASLADVTDVPSRSQLAERIYRAELHAPTRPHPYIPHRGMAGKVARGVALRVDRFWDAAEGRMVPAPIKPHRSRDGRLAQYLLADPHLPE